MFGDKLILDNNALICIYMYSLFLTEAHTSAEVKERKPDPRQSTNHDRPRAASRKTNPAPTSSSLMPS